MTRSAAALLAFAVMLGTTACTSSPPDPEPTARGLVRALESGDVSKVRWAGAKRAEVRSQLAAATDGLGDRHPQVRLVRLSGQDERRTATLATRWRFAPDGRADGDWDYRTRARLVRDDTGWRVSWDPAIVAPGLTKGARLVLRRSQAERADITGAGGVVLVTERPVRRLGIDKTRLVPTDEDGARDPAAVPADAALSARRLARVVDIDPAPYAARVQAAGPRAFVPAITLRSADAEPLLSRLTGIPGAVAVETRLPLAPTRDFARQILGSVGDATAEIVSASKGAVTAGDTVGLSGLQRRYDAQLRGVPGSTVELAPAPVDGKQPTREPQFQTTAVPGEPLATTLDASMQQQAERVLADVRPASALVAVRASTGEVLAAASGPGGGGLSTATTGRFAPGSTFKVVTSLALLRAGLTPRSPLRCPAGLVVDGKRFKNYDDYPPSGLGEITLATAVANSCNTAFIGSRDTVDQAALKEAATSLGLGIDFDLGLPAFLGSVPADAGSATEHAASMIGQGKVLASPLAMAGVAASVAAGRTVVPHLLAASVPGSASTLTPAEASALRGLMYGVVQRGSARFLADLPGPRTGAKTGTAEYGTAAPLRTHGWMIAVRGDLAVAVFVQDAQSGSRTAGPLLEAFLRGVL